MMKKEFKKLLRVLANSWQVKADMLHLGTIILFLYILYVKYFSLFRSQIKMKYLLKNLWKDKGLPSTRSKNDILNAFEQKLSYI